MKKKEFSLYFLQKKIYFVTKKKFFPLFSKEKNVISPLKYGSNSDPILNSCAPCNFFREVLPRMPPETHGSGIEILKSSNRSEDQEKFSFSGSSIPLTGRSKISRKYSQIFSKIQKNSP